MSDPVERFTAVFEEHYPRVLAYARRRTDASTADDVVADVFLTAWRHIERLPDDPLPWLYRTAGRSLANQARSRWRQQRLADRLAAPGTGSRVSGDHADQIADADLIAAALTKMRAADREALLLVAWENLDPQRAAIAMGCSYLAFRTRLHRARRRLQRLLDEQPPAVDTLVLAEET